MQTKSTQVIGRATKVGMICAMALSCAGLAGCSSNPGAGSPAYKQGELGNGGFLFGCDDTVSCDRWSGDAKRFPDQIATGSNFSVRFVANGDQSGSSITINDKRYDGVTSEAIGPYVGTGPDGLAAIKPGYAAVVARDNRGVVIDYATLKFVQPDALIVYEAEWDAKVKGNDVTKIQTITLKPNDSKSYRTLAEHKLSALAGALRVEWHSGDDTVVQVESYTKGVVRIIAKGPGQTKLTAVGAALTKEIAVEVTK